KQVVGPPQAPGLRTNTDIVGAVAVISSRSRFARGGRRLRWRGTSSCLTSPARNGLGENFEVWTTVYRASRIKAGAQVSGAFARDAHIGDDVVTGARRHSDDRHDV